MSELYRWKKGENVIKNPNAQKREEQYGNVAVTDLMTTISTHTDSLYLIHTSIHIIYVQTYATEYPCLTEVAGEGGPDLAPQKSLLSQKFRHLMRGWPF